MKHTQSVAGFMTRRDWLMPRLEKNAPKPVDVYRVLDELMKKNPAADERGLAEAACQEFAKRYGRNGAMLSIPGTVPGLGTLTQIGVEAASVGYELNLMLEHQAMLCFVLAAIYGRPPEERQERLEETLYLIGSWTGAWKSGADNLAVSAGQFLAKQVRSAPAAVVSRVQRKVATKLLTSFAARATGKAAGRLVPFGIGAALAYGVNRHAMMEFAEVAKKYYADGELSNPAMESGSVADGRGLTSNGKGSRRSSSKAASAARA